MKEIYLHVSSLFALAAIDRQRRVEFVRSKFVRCQIELQVMIWGECWGALLQISCRLAQLVTLSQNVT